MDFKLDQQEKIDFVLMNPKNLEWFSYLERFLGNKAFWYIAIALCIVLYRQFYPFMKYAPDLMVNKFFGSKTDCR